MSDTPRTDAQKRGDFVHINFARELERENAALREAKDAYFKHNNILVELMTEEQRKKALEILISRPKETQS